MTARGCALRIIQRWTEPAEAHTWGQECFDDLLNIIKVGLNEYASERVCEEREACAMACEALEQEHVGDSELEWAFGHAAGAIRYREKEQDIEAPSVNARSDAPNPLYPVGTAVYERGEPHSRGEVKRISEKMVGGEKRMYWVQKNGHPSENGYLEHELGPISEAASDPA